MPNTASIADRKKVHNNFQSINIILINSQKLPTSDKIKIYALENAHQKL